MDSEQLAELIMNAAAEFNAGIVRELASPTTDVVERTRKNNRWERQIRERLFAFMLDLEKIDTMFRSRGGTDV